MSHVTCHSSLSSSLRQCRFALLQLRRLRFPENQPDADENEGAAGERPEAETLAAQQPAKEDCAWRSDERNGLEIRDRHPGKEPVEQQKGQGRARDRQVEQAKGGASGPVKMEWISFQEEPGDDER